MDADVQAQDDIIYLIIYCQWIMDKNKRGVMYLVASGKILRFSNDKLLRKRFSSLYLYDQGCRCRDQIGLDTRVVYTVNYTNEKCGEVF